MFGDKESIAEIRLETKQLVNSLIQILAEATQKIDLCFDSNFLSILKEEAGFWNVISNLKSKELEIRFVVEIDSDNLQFCNKLINKGNSKIFHKNNVKGNFAIVDDNKYLSFFQDMDVDSELNRQSMDTRSGNTANQIFYIGSKPFVDLQRYLFDNLCTNSISAEEKIREIKRECKENFNKSISNPEEILNMTIDTIYSAAQEILILIPTENSFHRLEYAGILDSLWNAALEHNIMIKILLYINQKTDNQSIEKNNTIKEKIEKVIRKDHLSVEIQYLLKPLENNIITIIMDESVSLAIEISDDSQMTFEKTIRSAIYSNSEITISSCISIFDTLWIQSELDKQNKIKQVYFQMFKGFDLKKEIYTRKWSFKQNKK